MGAELSTAVSLLLTGMITVFVVLFLVVITGNLLIRFVNAFFPEVVTQQTSAGFDSKKVAVINAAVELVTEGKGRVEKIERKS